MSEDKPTPYYTGEDPGADVVIARLTRERDHANDAADEATVAAHKAIAERDAARELLTTLVYWHDQGGVDESWWDEARKLTGGKP